MPISGSHMSGLLQTAMFGRGYTGVSIPDFADAIGIGSVSSIIGKAFSTTDTGTVPGAGTGSGTGLTGIVQATLSNALFSALVTAFGQAGADLVDICDDLATAFVQEMALAKLTSTHSPVYVGTGAVVVGSIVVSGSAMGSAIEGQGVGSGFIGDNWGDVADVVGSKFAAALALASGSVTITGSPTGTPAPGAGTGTGTIT